MSLRLLNSARDGHPTACSNCSRRDNVAFDRRITFEQHVAAGIDSSFDRGVFDFLHAACPHVALDSRPLIFITLPSSVILPSTVPEPLRTRSPPESLVVTTFAVFELLIFTLPSAVTTPTSEDLDFLDAAVRRHDIPADHRLAIVPRDRDRLATVGDRHVAADLCSFECCNVGGLDGSFPRRRP